MSEESKQKRTRSPAYPAIDLEEAISKAATLWQKITRHSASIETVGGLWGYDKNSSAGGSVVAAMLKYGLLVDQGEKDKREVRLTEDAIRLTYNPDSASKEHQEALKRAALSPKIHAELWKRYGGIVPDDSVVKHYLVVDRKFNDQYVDGFIKQFKKTIKFANLMPCDKVPMVENEELETVKTTAPEPTAPEIGKRPFSAFHPPPSTAPANGGTEAPPSGSTDLVKLNELAVPIGDGMVARVPYPISDEDFELFVATLKLWKRKLVKTPATTDEILARLNDQVSSAPKAQINPPET